MPILPSLPQVFWKTPRLPIEFFGNFNLGKSRISCCNGFKGIVSSAEGVLGDMRGRHRLACRARSKTSRVVFFRFAGGRVSCKRSLAYIGHLEHACANPGPAGFYGFAGSAVLRVCRLKKWKHPSGAVRSPDCQRSLILFAEFLHCFQYNQLILLSGAGKERDALEEVITTKSRLKCGYNFITSKGISI